MTSTRTLHAPISDPWGRTSALAVHVRRLTAPIGRFASRGQLGRRRETELGRRSGARV